MATAPAKTKQKNAGREARKQTPVALVHAPNLTNFYNEDLPSITPGDFAFKVELLRPGLDPFPLDTMLESLDWSDEASALTGTLTLYRRDPLDPTTVPVVRGDQVKVSVTWDGKPYVLWTMRASAPQTQVDQGIVTVPLKDDLILLDANDMDWIFRKTKAKPDGFTASEITVAVAKRLGLGVGSLAPSTVKQSLVKRKASGRDVITAAWQREHQKSGRAYILRLRDQKVEVVTITQNPSIYVLGQQIQTALLAQKGGAKSPTTVLTGIAHIGKGKKAQKITYTLFDRKVVDVLGHVPATKQYGVVTSHSELRDLVTRDLAQQLRLPDTVTIDTPGIPFILRGDGAQVALPAEGYSGKNSFVFCQSADHTVQDGQYTTEFVFGYTDPVVAELNAEAKAAAARANKSATRNQPTNSSSGDKWLVIASAEDDPAGIQAACRVLQTTGYSELSTVPEGAGSDFAALGKIPCLTSMIITNPANGKSTTAQKQDVGAGSSFLPVMGLYPGTRAELGLDDSGEYHVVIQRADGGALTPVRGTRQ